jgi:thioredoxin-like negative regulator of GroEL
MKSFILLVSLTALCLGFAGTALGVRPVPVQADAAEGAPRVRVLQSQVEVLTAALEDLEQRLEEHRARTTTAVDPVADQHPATPLEDELASAPHGAAETLAHAGTLLAAGDAGGARAIYRRLATRDDVTLESRVQARLGLASTWEAVENRSSVLEELDALRRDLESDGAHPALLKDVTDRLNRARAGR